MANWGNMIQEREHGLSTTGLHNSLSSWISRGARPQHYVTTVSAAIEVIDDYAEVQN
jgi:hypothetical protein